MSGILRLESLTKGNTLKQGDKTPLKYRLFDADGEKLNITGKSAKVRLVYPDFLTIGYEKDGLTVAQDDTVTFTIDNVIPPRMYHVEIIVDDKFIFPSRADETKFTIDNSSLGTEANIIEIVGVDAVVRKAVDLINKDPNLIIDEDKLVGDIISNTGIGNIEEYYQQFNDVITELSEEKDYHSLPEIAGARRGYNTLAESLQNLSADMLNPNLGKLTQIHMSDELLAQIAGNAPINAVPADGGVTTPKYADKSITPVKLSGVHEISGENLYHPSDIINGKFIFSSGSIIDDGESSMATINVSPNTIYSFWRKRNRWEPGSSGPLLLNNIDGSKDVIDASTLTKGIHLGYEYVVFETDTNTVSVSFNVMLTSPAWDSSDTTILVEGSTIPNKKEIKKIFSSEITDAKARDAIINYDKQTELTTPINLYNQNYIIEGKVAHSSGTIRDDVNASIATVRVSPNTIYSFWRKRNEWRLGWSGPLLLNNIDGSVDIIDTSTLPKDIYLGYEYVVFETNTDTVSVTFNTKLSNWDSSDTTILVEGDNIDGAKEISKIFGMDIKPKPYAGKKWVAFGDSLTEKNSRTTLNYHDYVSDDLGITVINMGVGGSGYKRRDDVDRAFYQRVNDIPLDADVITIFGSFNDLSAGIPIGTPSDTGIETLGGSINTTLDNLNARLPIVPVGIIAPTPWHYSKPWDETDNSTQYTQLLKEICNDRGIPFLDLYHSSGLRPWEADYRTLMYSRDEGSGTHPDENGHKLFYPQIREFLKSLI